MGALLNIVTPLHKSTKRNYIERMMDDKVACMEVAGKFDAEFWDGDRRFGYGGYTYDGRWAAVAQALIDHYRLRSNAKILDVGCGKGYLLYELKKLLPDAEIQGFDISGYAIDHAKEEIKDALFCYHAQKKYPYDHGYFDLVLSLTTLHNLHIFDLKTALEEIDRVGKNKYILVEGYRNEEELFNLQCWALTCRSFYTDKEWVWLYEHFGYTGDFEFIYFE